MAELFGVFQKYLASDGPNATGWWDAYCPIHNDHKRSAGFNFEIGRWKCQACRKSGKLEDLAARLELEEVETVGGEPTTIKWFPDEPRNKVVSIQSGKKGKSRPLPNDEEIQLWCDNLLDDEEALEIFIAKRGLDIATIKQYQIGWKEEPDGRRYLLPIRDRAGHILNLRCYSMDPTKTKMRHWTSGLFEGAHTILPIAVLLDNEDILLCEGEWDALLANQHGIPAVSHTDGVGNWADKYNKLFKGKNVWIAYDKDKAGDDGTALVCDHLRKYARSIYICDLPLAWTEKHGEDITDFFVKYGHTTEDLQDIMREARVELAPSDGKPIAVGISQSFNADLVRKPLSMTVSIVGRMESVHNLPHNIVAHCHQDQPGCPGCPMQATGRLQTDIDPSDPMILGLRDVPTERMESIIRSWIGTHCKFVEIDANSYYVVEELLVRNSVDRQTGWDSDLSSRNVINIGYGRVDTNSIANITGAVFPIPKTQHSAFQSWLMEPVESSLDSYEVTLDDTAKLQVFESDDPMAKLEGIAQELSNSVTMIYGRNLMHTAMDLVWHSVIDFNFDGRPIERGWLDALIVGDSRTGKSEVAKTLSRHYGFGKVVSCEAASIPGILGAVKQTRAGAWMLEWGAIPINDRRLVVLDEAGGLTTEQIGQLSSVRSSGVAEITKAETQHTLARTRKLWLSNPRNTGAMSSYMYGVAAVAELIGNQEDIARFDFAMSVASDDVNMNDINQSRPAGTLTYTAELCHLLLRWVWSRTNDQVVWSEGTESLVFNSAKEMSRQYVPDPPLVQGADIRNKIARISAAMAARLHSTDVSGELVVIKPEHVKSTFDFLNRIYQEDSFGYYTASLRVKGASEHAVASMDDAVEYLKNTTHKHLVGFLLNRQGRFSFRQLMEMTEMRDDEARMFVHTLSEKGMLEAIAGKSEYRTTREMNQILREIK